MAAICSFLGHYHIYDVNIHEKLRQALEKVAWGNEEVELWLDDLGYGNFTRICLAAALQLKWRYPKKRISITFVVKEAQREAYIAQAKAGTGAIPPCIVDKVISPPHFPAKGELKNDAVLNSQNKRWVMLQSTHIIRYLYVGLNEGDSRQQYNFAEKAGAAVLDITEAETASYITECIHALPEREAQIMEKLHDGEAYKQIGAWLGVTRSAVQQASKRAGAHLQKMVRSRLQQLCAQAPQRTHACCICNLRQVTYERLRAFEQALSFLLSNYNVTAFYVQQNYCRSGYMAVLEKMAGPRKIPIVASVSYPEMPESQRRALERQYCPPCDRVENTLAQHRTPHVNNMRLIQAMVGQSRFCICNLSGSALDKSIQNHIAKMKGKVVFNIGKNCAGAE